MSLDTFKEILIRNMSHLILPLNGTTAGWPMSDLASGVVGYRFHRNLCPRQINNVYNVNE